MKSVLIVIAICLGFVGLYVVGTALRVALLPARVVDRSIGTLEGITDKTLTADNAIYNYEWFKQRKASIEAQKGMYITADAEVTAFEQAAGPRASWTFEDKNEYSRLISVRTGIKNNTATLVAEYNARAAMANRNIFLDGKIPGAMELGASMLK